MKTDNDKSILITPDIKIAVLLDNYPQLEDTLIEISPRFEKLKNPYLRKTVAKVTTLRQAAIIGEVNLSTLVNKLRKETGQEEKMENELKNEIGVEQPEWFNSEKIVVDYDAEPDLQAGIHPVAKVTKEMEQLKKGDIYLLRTSFIPAPLIDLMKNKDYRVFSKKTGENEVTTYICK